MKILTKKLINQFLTLGEFRFQVGLDPNNAYDDSHKWSVSLSSTFSHF